MDRPIYGRTSSWTDSPRLVRTNSPRIGGGLLGALLTTHTTRSPQPTKSPTSKPQLSLWLARQSPTNQPHQSPETLHIKRIRDLGLPSADTLHRAIPAEKAVYFLPGDRTPPQIFPPRAPIITGGLTSTCCLLRQYY